MGLNISQQVLVKQYVERLDAIAEEAQKKNQIKQTGRSQQATSCEAVANSMAQGQNVQPVQQQPAKQ